MEGSGILSFGYISDNAVGVSSARPTATSGARWGLLDPIQPQEFMGMGIADRRGRRGCQVGVRLILPHQQVGRGAVRLGVQKPQRVVAHEVILQLQS